MQSFLLDILVDPVSGDTLTWNSHIHQLENPVSTQVYAVLNGIPVILPVKSQTDKRNTSLHEDFNSEFDYAGHYQTDAEYFNYFREPENRSTWLEKQRLEEYILSEVPGNARLVLDVGCGNAWVAKALLPKGKKVISMDISTVNPLEAITRYPGEHHAAIVADALNLPFKPGSVDCVIASEIMEHVANPTQFIESLTRVLKPGGSLIITTPYNEKIEYSICVHCNKPTPRHAHLHSINEKVIHTIIYNQLNMNYTVSTFSNVWLMKTRLNNLMAYLPFRGWRMIDRLFNSLANRPSRCLIKIVKE
jgi:2-polyprenyl-3-methyl-5-hydroxy-6-metoxy-1,4-benzoquinol methylase/uncharacterized protein YbaR (Trm112 family)